jgi:hypothetical protein
VDNLQAVAFRQVGFGPLIAGNDASIQLDGYAIRFHPQLLHETGEGERRAEIAGFAIDDEVHRNRFSQGECLEGKFGSLAW